MNVNCLLIFILFFLISNIALLEEKYQSITVEKNSGCQGHLLYLLRFLKLLQASNGTVRECLVDLILIGCSVFED